MPSKFESAGGFKKFLLLSIPTIILFFLLEIGVRVLRPDIDLLAITGQTLTRNPISEWAYNDPFSAYSGKTGSYADGKSVNKYGFISTPEIEMEKPEGRTRIVFLGGSSTAGTGTNLSDEETWPWLVTETLRSEHNMDVDFINAALSGYSTFESYGKLWSLLRFFDPDIIVVYHGWNDMYYFNKIADDPYYWRRDANGSWSVEFKGYYQLIRPVAIDKFIYWSQFLIRIRLRTTNIKGAGEIESADADTLNLSPEFNKKGLDLYRDNLRLMRSFAELFDMKLYVVKQASLLSEATSPEDKLRIRYEYHGFDHDAHIRAFNSIYDIIDREIDPDHIIDATTVSGRTDFFYDHIHPTPLGARELAAIVAEALSGK